MNNIKRGYIFVPVIIIGVIVFIFYKNCANSKIDYDIVDPNTVVDENNSFYTNRDNGELYTYKEETSNAVRLTTIKEVSNRLIPSKNPEVAKALSYFSVKGDINAKVTTGSDEYWVKYKTFKTPTQVTYEGIDIIIGNKVYTPDGYMDTDQYFFYCSDLLNIMTSLRQINIEEEGEETITKDDQQIDCYTYSYSTKTSAKIKDLSRKFYINKKTMKIEMVECDLGRVEFYDFDGSLGVDDIEYKDEIITNIDFPFIDLSKYVVGKDEENQDE